MGFGDYVSALLETYSKCLDHLKGFQRSSSDDTGASDVSSLLRSSVKSDQTEIRRAYASRLSRDGRRLEKGDGRSRSSLRKILKKLNAAITDLLHIGKTQKPVLNYESLLRLSNSSRAEAIATIDQLSLRLASSPSRRSLAGSSSLSSSTGSNRRHHQRPAKPETKRRPSSSSERPKESRAESKVAPRKKSSNKLPTSPDKAHGPSGSAKGVKRTPSLPQKNVAGVAGGVGSGSSGRGGGDNRVVVDLRNHDDRHRAGHAMPNRVSMLSMSSDSTKLGEIPERKLRRRRQEYDSSSSEYNVRPTYPLKPYQTTEPKPKGFWGGLFSSKR